MNDIRDHVFIVDNIWSAFTSLVFLLNLLDLTSNIGKADIPNPICISCELREAVTWYPARQMVSFLDASYTVVVLSS